MKTKKRGRSKLLPEEIMTKTIQTIRSLQYKSASIIYNVINAITKRIVVASDRTMLVEQGGHLTFTVNWAQNVLNVIIQSERKMVRRMTTTTEIHITISERRAVFLSLI